MRPVLIVSAVLSAPALQPCDVFEQPHPAGPKKIEFHISVPEVSSIVGGSGAAAEAQSEDGTGKSSHPLPAVNSWFIYFFMVIIQSKRIDL